MGLSAVVIVASLVGFGLVRILAARRSAEVGWRAAEEARRREADRADDLLVARAEALVADDPTATAALLDRLASPSSGPPTTRTRKQRGSCIGDADGRSGGVSTTCMAASDLLRKTHASRKVPSRAGGKPVP